MQEPTILPEGETPVTNSEENKEISVTNPPGEVAKEEQNAPGQLLEWDPAAKVTITGEQFGNMNKAIREILSNFPAFSLNDLMFRTQAVAVTINALKTCEEIVTQMKNEGTAIPTTEEQQKKKR